MAVSVVPPAQSAWLTDLGTGQPGILRGDSPAILHRIGERDVGLCIWRRTAPVEIIQALEALAPGDLPNGRALAQRRHVEPVIASILEGTRLAGAPLERFLVEDIAMLAACYARVAASEIIDVRLEAVNHDACWKFHRDRSRLRLITTYRGAGTQIVPASNVDEALQAQRAYLGPIVQLPAFAVAVFKGEQTIDGGGVLHRSPPIAGTGMTRLVLCMDGPSAASPPVWTGRS
ncbi:DUF1826 domain-containing protein [Dongia deserti]|uniref:DUF1826 domain-containing protein n=1 Tax=Dongia deserti TaxID=2268030 RepID=UPI0013C48977|nr:DUF1826 domain-containing protein [Dongia deserti]